MLFHEIYGSYYRAVGAILGEAVQGTLTSRRLQALVREYAFGESLLHIPEGLIGERWRLLHRDLSPAVEHKPERGLTLLEKRWLRALLLDPRIRLFDVSIQGLEEVKPLFNPELFVFFDRSGDGDNYREAAYIAHFRTILTALREKRNLSITFSGRRSQTSLVVTPQLLEYSEKDDCFRLIASGRRWDWTIRLSRILECSLAAPGAQLSLRPRHTRTLTFELRDERNALERVLLHFSHLEKETCRLDESLYRVTLRYDSADETELLVRVLSFGPMLRVIEPVAFVQLLRERIERQRALSASIKMEGSPLNALKEPASAQGGGS